MSGDRLASLAMYAWPPAVDAANDQLWAFVRDHLREEGVAGVPEGLDRSVAYSEPWLDPRLLLAQTCGLPFTERLHGRVDLVATPVYRFPGGVGPIRCSYIVVAANASFASVEALRGCRAAINDTDSNSGFNLLRALVAPLSKNGRFFASVTATGGHRASLAAVSAGYVDVAAIDSVVFGLAAQHAPEAIAGVRVLTETPATPWLPYITRADPTGAEVAALRRALSAAIGASELAAARSALGLVGLAFLQDDDYGVITRYAAEAAALGYHELG